MRDEWVIYIAGHPLLNSRYTRLPGCFYFPKRKLLLLKARYSLTVLKVLLNSNQSIIHFSFAVPKANTRKLGARCFVLFWCILCKVVTVYI